MDIERLLKLLNDNNVDYIIIGATAFPIPHSLFLTLYLVTGISPDLP